MKPILDEIHLEIGNFCTLMPSIQLRIICSFFFFCLLGSITNIDDDANYRCNDGSSPEALKKAKVISGVVAAASSVTSIQVANLLKLFKIPQVGFYRIYRGIVVL